MKTKLVITDLTRMYQGRVCVAGYDKDGKAVRPVLPPPGISEQSLLEDGRPIIFPFALVEYDLLDSKSEPPHTEDIRYVENSPSLIRTVKSREQILNWSIFESVEAIFEQPVLTDFGFYIMDCQGPRSLGTIRPRKIIKAKYERGPEGTWDYRLLFHDRTGEFYRLKITDLTWQYYCQNQRGSNRDQAKIAASLTDVLKSSKVYLRIGLARGWQKYPDRCYLQITGIFTFPDYLDGRTFVDFTPKDEID
jgi:hypothetical protein